MKNWYKRPATKGLLVLLAHILVVSAVLSISILLSFSWNLGSMSFLQNSSKPYEESTGFKNMIYRASSDVMEIIAMKNKYGSEGKYDPNKVVDIVSLA